MTQYSDEVQPFIAKALRNPEIRAAYEDAMQRHRLIDRLVALRKSLDLTQTEVARRMGVKQPMVSEFENERSDPRLSTVQRYARAVEIAVSWDLDYGSGDPELADEMTADMLSRLESEET